LLSLFNIAPTQPVAAVRLVPEQLKEYLRNFANIAGEVVPYDTNGGLHLLLALVDNLRENALEADLREIVPEVVSAEQAAFLGNLASLTDGKRSV
jgi:hypothetical protein